MRNTAMRLHKAFDPAPFRMAPHQYFASLAMQGFMAAFLPQEDLHFRNIAESSHRAAEAMMRAREPSDFLTVSDYQAGMAMQAQLMDYEPESDREYDAVAKRAFRMAYAMASHLAL